MSDDTETTFPSTTFAGSFNGCSSISADFSGDLKFKVSDVPNVLRDLHRLGSGPFDLTIVSRQGQLAGDSVDREWSSMELQAEEEAGIEYAATCIGGACPHFAVHGSGDLAGSYVCQLDADALMVVVHGETRCPLYPQAETVGNADDDGVDELPIEGEEVVQHTPDTLTEVELITEYRDLRDCFCASNDEPAGKDAARFDALVAEIAARWPKWAEATLDQVLCRHESDEAA